MAADRSVLSRPASPPDEVVSYDGKPEQIADVRFGDARAEARPLALMVHGGFWRPSIDRTHTGPMCMALAAAGWTVASAEYRRIPHDPDTTLADVGRALEILPTKVRRHNGKVVLMGHSAGGHLVLWATVARRTPELLGTLALAPAADLLRAHELNLGDGAVTAFLDTGPRNRADVDPRRMSSPEVPTTILHGDEDDIVPFELAKSYVAAHPKVRLVRLHGAGHFQPIDPLSKAWPTVLEELQNLATTPS